MVDSFGSKSKKPIRVRYDAMTEKWAKAHPDYVFTARSCDDCGLFYKSSLGHKCKARKDDKE